MKQTTRTKIFNALHHSRMAPYLHASGNNEKKALALYQWHTDLSSAVQSVLGLTEVILRNAIDRELQKWNQQQAGTGVSWLLEDPASPLRSLTQGKRLSAKDRAESARSLRAPHHPRRYESVSHDDVLAQVMFGMWKDILPNHKPGAGDNRENRNRQRMWEEAVKHAFPHVDDPDGKETFWCVARLHELRNRVSHMEPLLNIDVDDIIKNDAFRLISSIDPDVGAWVSGRSKVSFILKEQPQ